MPIGILCGRGRNGRGGSRTVLYALTGSASCGVGFSCGRSAIRICLCSRLSPDINAVDASTIVAAIAAIAAIKVLPGVAKWGFNKVIGWFR